MAKPNSKPKVAVGGAARSRLVDQMSKPSGIAPPDHQPHIGQGGNGRVGGVIQSPAGPPPNQGGGGGNGDRQNLDTEHIRGGGGGNFTTPGGGADRSALLAYFDHLRNRVNRQFDHVYDQAHKVANSLGLDMQQQGHFIPHEVAGVQDHSGSPMSDVARMKQQRGPQPAQDDIGHPLPLPGVHPSLEAVRDALAKGAFSKDDLQKFIDEIAHSPTMQPGFDGWASGHPPLNRFNGGNIYG